MCCLRYAQFWAGEGLRFFRRDVETYRKKIANIKISHWPEMKTTTHGKPQETESQAPQTALERIGQLT